MNPSFARLVLVRHGRTEHNLHSRLTGWGDPELDALGLAQARLVGRHVAQTYRVDLLFSSPLLRALETARQIGREAGLQPVVVESLKEVHFGDCEGLTEEEIAVAHPEVFARSRVFEDMEFGWPNGETRSEFNTRVRSGLDEVIRRSLGKTAVVASHGGVIANLLATLETGNPAMWPRYIVHNCSTTEVETDGEHFRIVKHNDVSYLPEAARTTQFVTREESRG